MGQQYLGGSGESLTVWISTASSIVLIFYGYDQVGIIPESIWYLELTTGSGRFWQCAC